MAARAYSQFSQRTASYPSKGTPTGRRGSRATLPQESTAKWPALQKECACDRSLGMPAIKTFVAGHYMPKGSMMMGRKPMMKSMPPKGKLEAAMHEVFTDEPSTVTRAKVSGARKTRMMRAIAFSKARRG